MSIIQEALRKAQKTDVFHKVDGSERATPAKIEVADGSIEKRPKTKTTIKSALYALIFLTLLLILAIKYFSTIPTTTPANLSAPMKDTAETSEATRPVVEKQPLFGPLILTAPAVIQQENFTLAGIMHLEDGPRAIVNGSTVIEGDVVGGAVVTKITDNSVVLKKQNSEIVLHLK